VLLPEQECADVLKPHLSRPIQVEEGDEGLVDRVRGKKQISNTPQHISNTEALLRACAERNKQKF